MTAALYISSPVSRRSGTQESPRMLSVNPAALRGAADWLLEKEVRVKGDWSVKLPGTEPGGWAFEFNNDPYPDVDDTAMVLLGLSHAQAADREAQRAAEQRAI